MRDIIDMIITLTTDIGWVYAAEMKGTILKISPSANIVDVSHAVSPQNVVEGAFIIRSVAHHFPKDAVHVGVVDPGVGTHRRCLVIACRDGILVGPDNGLLIPASERLGLKKVYEITNEKYMPDHVSCTFHGRDVLAPVAAHISKGVKPAEFGDETDEYTKLERGEVTVKEGRISGEVMFIDQFGNMITNIPGKMLKKVKPGGKVNVRLGWKTFSLRYLQSYGFAEEGEMLVTVSSFDLLEIASNMENAGAKLGAIVGEKVTITVE